MSKKKKGPLTKIVNTIVGTTLATPFVAAAGWIAYSNFFVSRKMPLPPAVSGERKIFTGNRTKEQLSYYVAGESNNDDVPLLVIHSINAAASTYEVRPIFEHYRQSRHIYSLDLPGYGFSARSNREYTPRLFTNAVMDMVDIISQENGNKPVDVIALSLGSEFVARAASENPERFRTLAFISPTGLRKGEKRFYEAPESVRGNPNMFKTFNFPLWSRPFFDLLSTRKVQYYFLRQLFSPQVEVDPGLIEYDYLTVHQPEAQYAPFTFVSGLLFSADIDRVYDGVKQPVWVSYGVLGRFNDVDEPKVLSRVNWSIKAFPTGSLPHYEEAEQFFAAYDEYLARAKQLLETS